MLFLLDRSKAIVNKTTRHFHFGCCPNVFSVKAVEDALFFRTEAKSQSTRHQSIFVAWAWKGFQLLSNVFSARAGEDVFLSERLVSTLSICKRCSSFQYVCFAQTTIWLQNNFPTRMILCLATNQWLWIQTLILVGRNQC